MSEVSATAETVPARIKRPFLSPLNKRRLQNFKDNQRGF